MEINNTYLPSTYETRRKHIMTVQAEMQDAETGTSFPSNVLTYEFEVSPAEDDVTWTYVNLAASSSSGTYSTVSFTDVDGTTRILPIIKATQYLPVTLDWGYSTD